MMSTIIFLLYGVLLLDAAGFNGDDGLARRSPTKKKTNAIHLAN